ncbi:MAG: MoxR family ATPase [Thermoanaerobaculia bacterium]|nr:MoxR family ATPase [Thermoanaerobaculia bacterium]
MTYLTTPPGTTLRLPRHDNWPETVHVLDERSIEAINAAIAARRPLLVRGEPGTGKSQLARAAAVGLERALVTFTVDSQTESRDLLYTVDHVGRLADAQILGHLSKDEAGDVRKRLAEIHYTQPGPLWWAFSWETAIKRVGETARPWTPKGRSAENGVVLLIDEIDKADPAVPNGLLEALGHHRFRVPSGKFVEAAESAVPPLVVITTNEERVLPDAFLRRCLVLQLGWKEGEEDFVEELMARGKAHFGKLSAEVLDKAARLVFADRKELLRRTLCPPGGAEYLDLLRVVDERWRGNKKEQLEALDRLREFALRKHPAEGRA